MKQRKLIFLRLLSLTSKDLPTTRNFLIYPIQLLLPCSFHLNDTSLPFSLGNLKVYAPSLSLCCVLTAPFALGYCRGDRLRTDWKNVLQNKIQNCLAPAFPELIQNLSSSLPFLTVTQSSFME